MYLFSVNKSSDIHTSGKKIPKEDFSSVLDAISLLEKAKKEAEKIIQDAKDEAVKIKQEAKDEAVKIKQEAKDSGYKEGLEPFNAHILHFENSIKKLRIELQNSILPLVNKTTRRIIGEGLVKHPELVVDIVANAIKHITTNHEIKLFVHKDDLEILEKHKEKLKNLFEHLEIFLIEERSDVEKGSCIIQTEKGILNANLENQYKALERALLSPENKS